MGYKQSNFSPNDLNQQYVYLSPRIYEVYEQVNCFQLRTYVLWASELVMSHTYKSVFVRIFFLNMSHETLIAENAINPVWNETLIFTKVI